MAEFEIVEGIIEAAEEAAEIGAELGEAGEVEAMVEVEEMAEAPAIGEGEAAQGGIRNFIENNPYGQKMWAFSKWLGKTAATAGAFFAVTYGLNQALAKKAKSTGKRTPLSEYLVALENNFTTKLGLDWNKEMKQKAATDALGYPWIDATM